MLKRFIRYYKPHKKMLALDMIASLLISVIGMVYPIVTNKMLNVYIPEKMYTTIVIAGLIFQQVDELAAGQLDFLVIIENIQIKGSGSPVPRFYAACLTFLSLKEFQQFLRIIQCSDFYCTIIEVLLLHATIRLCSN